MSHLTPKQIEELRQILLKKRAKLASYREDVEAADPTNDPGRIAANESGEDALEDYTIIETEALGNASNGMLSEIEAALARMDDGTYGVDEVTGEPIPFERLCLFPEARTGVKSAE